MTNTRNTLEHDVLELGGDIVSSERFVKAGTVPHHGKEGSVAVHSLKTAKYALAIARYLTRHGFEVSERDVVRASLLHDIGMTDDEVFQSPSHKKAYSHPQVGCRIAREEYRVNEVQADAILRHMWPIGHVPPKSLEGWVVVAADKSRSVREAVLMAQALLKRLSST